MSLKATPMPEPEAPDSRLRTLLLQDAVRFGHFVLASGRESDFYVDVKSVFLVPEVIELMGASLVAAYLASGLKVDAVGGMTLGADPLVTAFVLEARRRGLNIPGFIVRKEAKEHGTQKNIEGGDRLQPGSKVLLLEDVVTSGGSSLRTVEICKAYDLSPVAVLTVVDRQEGGAEAIESAGLKLMHLFSRDSLRKRLPQISPKPEIHADSSRH
jgi:orotate phosphoribosyltransferase